jgi:hypothetical protein
MTDPQPTESTVTIASQSIELALTGKPDVKNKWGAGMIRPVFVVFTYLPEGIRAHLYGVWVREDGELTDQPVDQEYRIGDTDEWPDWLAELARQHKPADRVTVLREAADTVFALDFDELRATSQFDSHRQAWELGTIDASTALRRMAVETKPAEEGEAHPPTRTWKVESPRRDKWAHWGATHDERVWAAASYDDVIEVAPQRPFRLVRATTTYAVEAEHQPAAGPAVGAQQPKEADGDRVVAYRMPVSNNLYCTDCCGMNDRATPVTSDDLPDGALCAGCGIDVLIPQQPNGEA